MTLFKQYLGSDHMSSQREGNIKENSALSAHMLFIISRSSNTCCSVHRGGVSSALHLRVPLEPDVSALAPGSTPAVPDQPVVSLSGIGSVSDQLDGVVQSNVLVEVASVKYSSAVPAPEGGIDGDGEGSDVGDVVHGGLEVVGNGVVSGDSYERGGVQDIVVAASSVGSRSGGVRVVCLSRVSEELDVGVSELGDGSPASTGSSAGEGVGGAGGDLLGGEGRQAVGGEEGVGLDHLGGGEGPAGAALSLVLDSGDGALLPPVNMLGEVLDGGHLEVGAGGRVGGGEGLVSSKGLGLELGISEIRKLVQSHSVGSAGLVVRVHLRNILRKHIEPVGILALGPVHLAVLRLELGKLDLQTLVLSKTKSKSKTEGE
jgi:hypothetical protein